MTRICVLLAICTASLVGAQTPQVQKAAITTTVLGPRAIVGIAVIASQPPKLLPSGQVQGRMHGPTNISLCRVVMPASTGYKSGWMWTGHGVDTRQGDGTGRLELSYGSGTVTFTVTVNGQRLGGGTLAVPTGLVWDRVRLQIGGQQPALWAMIRQTEVVERVTGTTRTRWTSPAQLQGWELCGPGYTAKVDNLGLRPARDGDSLLIRKTFVTP